MATEAKLKAHLRQDRGKGAARRMRARGRVPGVVYGRGDETRSISMDAHELELLFRRVHYENTLIELEIDGAEPVRTVVREVQTHPVRAQVLHVDFQQVHAGQKIHVEIPIRLVGTAAGVRAGGVLMHTISDLPVRVLPDNIPEYITVDISGLGINDSIHLRDIALPDGVEPEIDGDRSICSVAPPTVPVVAEPGAPAEAPGEPEVIGRARGDEE
jgi:large subunit ribosomal protein L25